MQITKTHHESGLGIYALSVPVKTKEEWKAAKEVAAEMCKWMDESNGKFEGEFSSAFAMAHCQVVESDKPLQLFVVARELVEGAESADQTKQNLVNSLFEAQAIFNCEILEAPEKITRKVPQRKVGEVKDGKAEVTMEMVDKEITNVISVKEACMSFQNRSERSMERKYRIRVRYQYLAKGLLGSKVESFEGWVEGLKAHIIQHEVGHFEGKNIHFNRSE
jgi:peptide deformylase